RAIRDGVTRDGVVSHSNRSWADRHTERDRAGAPSGGSNVTRGGGRSRTRSVLAAPSLLLGPSCDRVPPDTTPARPAGSPTAERVVSLVPLATRFVLAIGARDRLVAVDPDSARLPGVADLPTADLDSAARFDPDLVLVAAIADPGDQSAAALTRGGARLVEFAPHDFEDAL